MAAKQVIIKITNVNKDIKDNLKLIAKHEGVTVSQLLRPALRDICSKYPDPNHLKKFL